MIGIIIGVGIFRTPSNVAGALTSPALVILAWVIGGALSLCGALCYAELGAAMPRTGGDYVYLRESYGRIVGFLFGWTQILVIRVGSIAGVAFIFGEYLGTLFPFPDLGVKAAAVGAILLLTGVNLAGVRPGTWTQKILTVVKIASVVALASLPFLLGRGDAANFQPGPGAKTDASLFGAMGFALIFVLWTYGGWNESNYVAGEMKKPKRDLPISLLLGTLIITGLYVAVNLAYIYCLPLAKIAESKGVAADVSKILFGSTGKTVVAIVVMVSALGGLNGLILTSGRLSYAMGRDHFLFRWIGGVHRRTETPVAALIFNAVLASILVFWGTFEMLVLYTAAVFWVFFGLAGVGVIVLRWRFPDLERPYRVWGFPVVPLLFIASSAWMVYSAVAYKPKGSLIALGIMAAGLPFYFFSRLWQKKRTRLATESQRHGEGG
jgi:amino acid transporter